MKRSMLQLGLLSIMLLLTLHGQPALADVHRAAHIVAGRSWVDKRIDRLTAHALLTLPPSNLVDADRANVAASLVAFRRPMFFVWAFAQIFALFIVWRCGIAARVRDAMSQRIRNVHALRALFSAVWVIWVSVVALPFDLVNLHLNRIVGITHESLLNFLHDFAVGTGVEVAATAVVLVLILALVDCTRLWYVWATGLFLAFGMVALIATPVVLDPLFHTITPINPTSAFGKRFYAIEQQAGTGYVPIFLTNLSRTSEVGNANVEGIGPTRRVMVGDSLLTTATPAEVSFVIAHELGHVAHDDMLTLTLIADVLTILAIAAAIFTAERVAVRGDDDPLSRLLLIAALVGVYSLVIFPIGNAYSRMVEARADRFGLAIDHDPVAAARLFVRFADEGFSPLCPPRLVRLYFYDHPPLGSRITAATQRPDVCP